MPAKSEAQLRLMRAVAHNPQFAEKVGIPQSVGKEFSDAGMASGMMPKPHRVKMIADMLKRHG